MRGSAAFRVAVAPGGALAGPWVQNSLWTAARAVPSLDLRFADNKSLVDATTGQNLVTFTRASSGTFVGSDGVLKTATTNEPRFDHNPTTGESLGLLVEEARTNLVLRSEEFDNASWTKTRSSVTADAITAPNGTTTADTLIEDSSASATHFISQGVSITSGTNYAFSVFIKRASGSRNANLRWSGGVATGNMTVDLTTGAVTASAALQNPSATAFSNGWWRVTFWQAATSTGTFGPQIFLHDETTITYTGDGTSGIYIWGAQLEAGAFPTSYIPTTSATVTRAADVASITGSNFSGWYNQTEGTVFADAKVTTVAPATSLTSVFALSDGTTSNRITVYKRANADTSTRLDVSTSGSSVAFINAGTFSVSNLIAASYRVNDFAISLNALTPGADTLGTLPTVSRLNIGSYADLTFPLNGTLKRLTYWPTRLANTTLQAISQP